MSKKKRGRNTPIKLAIAGVVIVTVSLVAGKQIKNYNDASKISHSSKETTTDTRSVDERVNDYLKIPSYLEHEADDTSSAVDDGGVPSDDEDDSAVEDDSDTQSGTDEDEVKYRSYSLTEDDDYSTLLQAYLLDSLSSDMQSCIDADFLAGVDRSKEPYNYFNSIENMTVVSASIVNQKATFKCPNGKKYNVKTQMVDGKIVNIEVKEG